MTLRPDLKAIAEFVPESCRVLDVGCGDGELLAWLKNNKKVDARGVEISQAGVNSCIARGLSVVQGDADTDLQYYPDKAYDYVILSQTLQTTKNPKQVLENLMRIGKNAIISVPNFGYWKNRLYLLFLGRMPVTKTLSYTWYDTPNIHFCTLSDFVELCEALNIKVEKQVYVDKFGTPSYFQGKGEFANFFGEQGIFMLNSGDLINA